MEIVDIMEIMEIMEPSSSASLSSPQPFTLPQMIGIAGMLVQELVTAQPILG